MDEINIPRDRQVLYERFKKVVATLGKNRQGDKLIFLAIFTKLAAHTASEKAAIDQISRVLDIFE